MNRVSAYLDRVCGAEPAAEAARGAQVHRLDDPPTAPRSPAQTRGRDINVDGVGGKAIKLSKYRAFTRRRDRLWDGFKLFYEEDTG